MKSLGELDSELSETEEKALKIIEQLASLSCMDGADKRALALAKTNIEQGVMWAQKAIDPNRESLI